MSTIVITGIGRGIGKALAEKFLAEGHRVIGTVRIEDQKWDSPHLEVILMDLSLPESITECAEKIKNFGTIDILINNAGVLLDEDDTVLEVDKLRKTLDINLIGTVNFTEQLVGNMLSGGHIIQISSSAGSLDYASRGVSHYPFHYPAYKISKVALNMYTVTLSLRLKEQGIIVSSVHPGWVKTDMGGIEAEITPQEAAERIYIFAISHPETGLFWENGKRLPW